MQPSTYRRHYQQMLERLRRARKRSGLTQAETAARLGYTQSAVSKMERGERRIDAVELKEFAQLFYSQVEDLIP